MFLKKAISYDQYKENEQIQKSIRMDHFETQKKEIDQIQLSHVNKKKTLQS